MSEFNFPGIYYIKNKMNGLMYVGYSNNIQNRWWQHIGDFRTGRHYNKRMLYTYKKYGLDIFEFGVLEVCDETVSGQELGEKEKFYISLYKSNDKKYGYNCGEGGFGGPKGFKQSEEFKEKLSKSRMGENNPNYMGKSITKESKEKTRKKVLGKRRENHSVVLQGRKREGSSIYVGVRKYRGTGRVKIWEANACYKGKCYYLGNFLTEKEAAQAYDMQSLFFYGENAKLNFPELLEFYKEKQGHKFKEEK